MVNRGLLRRYEAGEFFYELGIDPGMRTTNATSCWLAHSHWTSAQYQIHDDSSKPRLFEEMVAFQRKIRTGDEVGFEHYAVNECPSILTFFAFIVNNLRSIC